MDTKRPPDECDGNGDCVCRCELDAMRAERDAALARLAEVERARVNLSEELYEARERSRGACQTIIESIGADGPESAPSAARRIATVVEAMRAERDDARRVAKRLAHAVNAAGNELGFAFFTVSLHSARDTALAYEVEP